MSKHKSLSPKLRKQVYEKYNGHCAYCGCKLEMKDMQVDHIKSVYVHQDFKHDMTDEEMNSIDNLMPACRQCNLYKSTMTLEDFRNQLETTLFRNTIKTFQFRLAEKYGLVQKTPHKIRFYFEEVRDAKEVECCKECRKYQTDWCPLASIDFETGFADENDRSNPDGWCKEFEKES